MIERALDGPVLSRQEFGERKRVGVFWKIKRVLGVKGWSRNVQYVAQRDARIAALEARVAQLEGRLNDLTKLPLPPRPDAALPKGPIWVATRGALNDGGGLMTLNGCTISGNSAGYSGGGIENISGGTEQLSTLTVNGSTIFGNSAAYSGGGIDNIWGARLTVNGSTISDNSAGVYGGGVYNTFSNSTFSILIATNSTICGNFAPSGADLSNTGTVTLTNSDVCIINQTITTTIVTSSTCPSVFGEVVNFTATISFVVPVGGTPAGTVTFLLDGNTILGVGTLNSSGQAAITAAGLSVGTHTITAIYRLFKELCG